MAIVAAIATGAALTIAPWMLRNCAVFDGQFCAISTNGGSVFYRVNNPDASGLYMSGRGTPLEGLSELERDRRGYELGRPWIRAHSLDAAKLSLRKWRAYLGGDDHGAYWGVLRGAGGNEADAVASASLGRMALYRVANVVSLAYWVLLAAMCARTILGWRVDDVRDGQVFRPLVYPLLCGAAVFGIFESGDRQHMFAIGPLIVLAAAGVVHRRGPRQAERGIAAQA